MKHSDARTLARNLALDRDSVVAGGTGGTANIDVARLLNDHISWYGANDRSKAYAPNTTTISIAFGAFSSLNTLTNILRVLAVTRESGGTTTNGTPIEIVQPQDIYHARSKSTATGTPTMIAFTRIASDGNSANVNKLRSIVHPPPLSTAHFALHVQLCNPEFTVSTIDDTEVMDYPQSAQYAIVREVALDMAIILRRPDSTWDSIMDRVAGSKKLTDNLAARDMATGPPRTEPK